jgi:hypothetical protein
MAVKSCTSDGKKGYQGYEGGICHTFSNESEREAAYARALLDSDKAESTDKATKAPDLNKSKVKTFMKAFGETK